MPRFGAPCIRPLFVVRRSSYRLSDPAFIRLAGPCDIQLDQTDPWQVVRRQVFTPMTAY